VDQLVSEVNLLGLEVMHPEQQQADGGGREDAVPEDMQRLHSLRLIDESNDIKLRR
jgi:hypothetical protein